MVLALHPSSALATLPDPRGTTAVESHDGSGSPFLVGSGLLPKNTFASPPGWQACSKPSAGKAGRKQESLAFAQSFVFGMLGVLTELVESATHTRREQQGSRRQAYYKESGARQTELENLLEVARIDSHRVKPFPIYEMACARQQDLQSARWMCDDRVPRSCIRFAIRNQCARNIMHLDPRTLNGSSIPILRSAGR